MKPMGFAAARLLIIPACIVLVPAAALARTLPVPPDLVALDSERGAALLLESEANRAYWPLSMHFVTQKTQTYCGVASIVMVLNALAVPAPGSPALAPFAEFDQDNFFNDRTEAIRPRSLLAERGMTLDQLGALFEAHGLTADVRHASDGGLDDFRRLAAGHLGAPGRFVVVNYLRRAIGQERGGHISPLAAYDADTDRFLILDVSRYKYPPVWVEAADLYAAMNTPDPDNGGRTRGYVVVTRGR